MQKLDKNSDWAKSVNERERDDEFNLNLSVLCYLFFTTLRHIGVHYSQCYGIQPHQPCPNTDAAAFCHNFSFVVLFLCAAMHWMSRD